MSDLKIICPFCNAPWTAKMKHAWEIDACFSDDSYAGIDGVEVTTAIYCDNCGKEIYRKEVHGLSYGPSEDKDRL